MPSTEQTNGNGIKNKIFKGRHLIHEFNYRRMPKNVFYRDSKLEFDIYRFLILNQTARK